METMPWYKSAIIRQQIAQLIMLALAATGWATDIDVPMLVEAAFGIVAGTITLWTIVTRLRKPAPPITQGAAEKEKAMILTGTIAAPMAPNDPAVRGSNQAGFVTPAANRFLMAAALAVFVATACTSLGSSFGTGSATKAIAGAYAALTTAREVTLDRLEAGTISADEAEAVQRKADNIRGVLDVASGRVAVPTAPGDGPRLDEPEDYERLLTRAIGAALALVTCADVAHADFRGCIGGIP